MKTFPPARAAALLLMVTTITLITSTLRVRMKNLSNIIASLSLLLGASLAAQEIDLFVTTTNTRIWNDAGSGAAQTGSFWRASFPGGEGYQGLCHVATSGLSQPLNQFVGKALTDSAFAAPTGNSRIWNDAGSGATNSGFFFRPQPPAGYVSLGDVCTTVSGLTSPIMCVREDLVVEASIGKLIWSDAGSGADFNFSAWEIVAPAGAIDLGGFVCHASHAKPTSTVYCLKASAVNFPAPTNAQIEQLIGSFGPIVHFHPDEPYLPDDPAVIMEPNATLNWVEVTNRSSYDNFNSAPLGTDLVTNDSLLTRVAEGPLSHPLAENPDFHSILEIPESTWPGNLSRAKSYVRVQPIKGAIIELQFWIFYPYNGRGKTRISIAPLVDEWIDPAGPLGSHPSDWELIRVRTTYKHVDSPGVGKKVSLSVSRHSGDAEYRADDPNLGDFGGSPIVYSAKDTHAHYIVPGRQIYRTVSETNLGITSAFVFLFDVPAAGGQQLATYQSSRHVIVSSAWPSVVTAPPDWFWFGGQWGGFEPHRWSIPLGYPGGVYTYNQDEVENGKPGLLRRGEFQNADLPLNANLGVLRELGGTPLSPAFTPNTTSYTMNLASSENLRLLAQASDYNALVEIRSNGGAFTAMPDGVLIGKAGSVSLVGGPNVVEVRVTTPAPSRQEPHIPVTVKTYTIAVETPPVPPVSEALDAPQLVWTTTGDNTWFAQAAETHDNVDAAQSGSISDNQESRLETTVTGPGVLSFWWKVSSEEDFDLLRMEVDGVEATTAISGEVEWQRVTVAIPSGSHTLSWIYSKDVDTSRNGDTSWVDEVRFTAPLLSSADTIYGGRLEGMQFVPGIHGGFVLGRNGWPASEGPAHAIDGEAPKYLNTGKENTGLVIVPAIGSTIAQDITLWTANDLPERDPASFELYGTRSTHGTAPFDLDQFELIASGALALPDTRNPSGSPLSLVNSQTVTFSNREVFTTYMIVFPSLKNSAAANSMQIGDIQIGGSLAPNLGVGLVNYWNFDNNLTDHAALVVNNASSVIDTGSFDGANGIDGINFTASGRFGSSIEQNGASGGNQNDGFVEIPRSSDTLFGANATNPGSPNTVTISAWVETQQFDSAFQTVLSHGEGSQYRIARRHIGDVISYAGGSPDIPEPAGGPSIAPGTGWHHVVAISEGGVSTRLWVDGTLVATGTAPIIDDSRGGGSLNLNIGANPNTGSQNREWSGRIDDVAMWNRTLTAVEVESLYLGGLADLSLGDLTTPLRSFAIWAAENIPAGEDTSFNGTIENGLIPNGIRYAFDNAAIEHPAPGVIKAPSDVPADVVVVLEYTEDLKPWTPAVTWTNGIPVIANPANVSIENGFVTQTMTSPKGFWRYRVNLVTP
jgi:hypothetical protein